MADSTLSNLTSLTLPSQATDLLLVGRGTARPNKVALSDALNSAALAATTSAYGVAQLAADGGTTAGTVVQATDARLSNARNPPDGDKGDITVSASGGTWTVDSDAITYAKIQNVSAASRLLGRGAAAGAGDVEEIILGTGLAMSGTTLSATGSSSFPDGTAAAPSISFTADTDTGLYRPGANQLSVSTGGSQTALFSSTGVTINPLFTATRAFEAQVTHAVSQEQYLRIGSNTGGSTTYGAEFGYGLTASGSPQLRLNTVHAGTVTNFLTVPTGTGIPAFTPTVAFNGATVIDSLPTAAYFGTGKRVSIGFDTANNYGFVATQDTGVSWQELRLNPYGGLVRIPGTTDPSSTITGALVVGNGVSGGIGVSGGVYSGGTLTSTTGTNSGVLQLNLINTSAGNAASSLFRFNVGTRTATLQAYNDTHATLAGQLRVATSNGDIVLIPSGVATATFAGSGISSFGGSVTSRVDVNGATSAGLGLRQTGVRDWFLSAESAELRVFCLTAGSVFAFNSGTPVAVRDTTASANTTIGALVVTGGAGVGGAINAGGTITSMNGSGSGLLGMRSSSGNASYIFWSETTVADRGILGFNSGSGTLSYRSQAYNFATGTEVFAVASAGHTRIGASGSVIALSAANNVDTGLPAAWNGNYGLGVYYSAASTNTILIGDGSAGTTIFATRTGSTNTSRVTIDNTNGNVTIGGNLVVTGTITPSGGGTKTYAVFTPLNNQPPATNFATLDTRNSIAVLDFDDGATNESAIFVSIMPEAASLGSGLKVRIIWTATTATSGATEWGVQFERLNTDIDSDSFDTAATQATTTNATSGVPNTTEITITTIDSITAGDGFRLKVYRDSSDTTNDTMTGDAELVSVEVRSAS